MKKILLILAIQFISINSFAFVQETNEPAAPNSNSSGKTESQLKSEIKSDENPYNISAKEQRNIEKKSDKVTFLRGVFEESARQGRVTFESMYENDKPISLTEALDFEHPELKKRLSSLDKKERDEIIEATREEEAKNNRLMSIMNEAAKFGMSAGMYETARMYHSFLTKTLFESLNEAFPYYALTLEDGKIKPALIDEVGVQRKVISKRAIHEVKRTIQVAEQAEVILLPPSYIEDMENLLQIPRPKIPAVYYMPIDEEERLYWKRGLANGWMEGNKQANRIVRQNISQMLRRMLGYIRFHSLVDHNMLSMPTTQNTNIGINSEGDVVNIGESMFEITQLPTINGDDQSWIALPVVDDIFGLLETSDVDKLISEVEEESEL